MILAVDVGNSNTVFGLFDNDNLIKNWRIITDVNKAQDDFRVVIQQLMIMDGLEPDSVTGVILSSVCPKLTPILKTALKMFKNANLISLTDDNIDMGIKFKSGNKKELGTDIVANVVAATKLYGENVMIIDMGTATTFAPVNSKGELLGVVIAPGANLCAEYIHRKTAQLMEVRTEPQEKVIGTNTMESLNSGLFFGYIGLVKEIVGRIKAEAKAEDMRVCLTGGAAQTFINDMPFIDNVNNDLTLIGLNEIWKLNNKKS